MNQHIDDPRRRHESLAKAIGLMTAWSSTPDSGDFSADLLESYLKDGNQPVVEQLSMLLTGMTNLSGALLTLLERDTGRAPEEVLQEVARSWDPDAGV